MSKVFRTGVQLWGDFTGDDFLSLRSVSALNPKIANVIGEIFCIVGRVMEANFLGIFKE
jgi:hypothetical protein